ncbi:MAG TPA: ABC transporter permease [Candidatus Kryptonia bacterium]|nr:ABC transporter permease [Candidatus Kryptonia bacterium]
MNLGRVAAITRKEFLQVRRDPRSLLIALFMPIMLLGLLGYGVRLDAKHVPLYVFDRDGSQDSQALLKRFQASEYFDLARVVTNYGEITAAIDAGRCKLALVVPPDFARRLRDGGGVAVQAIVDATDDNTANLAIGYATTVVGGFSQDVQLDWMRRQGLPDRTATPPLSIEFRTWYNEELESRNFIIPGVVALVMTLVGALLSSLTIAREWERGTMEQLVSTPVTAREIMIGKLIPYFLIGLIDAALCAAVGIGWFEVPFRGTLATLFVATALFLTVVLGIGFMISVAIPNQLGASVIAILVTLLPMNMLSGFAFPIDQMPAAIRAVTYVVWGRYYVTILKAVFLKGSGLRALAGPLFALVIYAAVVGTFATRAFRKTLT